MIRNSLLFFFFFVLMVLTGGAGYLTDIVFFAAGISFFFKNIFLPSKDKSLAIDLAGYGLIILLIVRICLSFFAPASLFSESLFRTSGFILFYLSFINNFSLEEKENSIALVVRVLALFAFLGIFSFLSNHGDYLFYKKFAYMRRVSGPLVNPNHFALLLASFSPFLFNVIDISKCKTKLSVFYASSFYVFYFSAFILTASFSGYLSLAVILAVSFALKCKVFRLKKRNLAAISMITVIASILFAVVFNKPGLFAAKIASISSHVNLYLGLIGLIREISLNAKGVLFGKGLGSFDSVYMHFHPLPSLEFFQHAHCDFFETFVETGLVGIIAVCFPLGVFLRNFFSCIRRQQSRFVIQAGLSAFCVAVFSLLSFVFSLPIYIFLLSFFLSFLPAYKRYVYKRSFVYYFLCFFLLIVFSSSGYLTIMKKVAPTVVPFLVKKGEVKKASFILDIASKSCPSAEVLQSALEFDLYVKRVEMNSEDLLSKLRRIEDLNHGDYFVSLENARIAQQQGAREEAEGYYDLAVKYSGQFIIPRLLRMRYLIQNKDINRDFLVSELAYLEGVKPQIVFKSKELETQYENQLSAWKTELSN